MLRLLVIGIIALCGQAHAFSKPRPAPTPAPTVAPKPPYTLNFNVDPKNASAFLTPDDGTGPFRAVGVDGRINLIVLPDTHVGWGASLRVEAEGYLPVEKRIVLPGSDTELESVVLKKKTTPRKGIVRAEGPYFVDDDGAFYPLGATLFWALHGWKFDRERLKANLCFLGERHYDYVRILAEVDWPNKKIDPKWADYDKNLSEFLDYAYAECGLRAEITLIGGGKGMGLEEYMDLAQTVARVIKAGREHKVLSLEIANESYQRPVTLDQMRFIGKFLRRGLPNLISLSSGEGLSSYAPNSTDWRADFIRVYMQQDSANLATIHMERTFGDLGWRAVRQPWDWKDYTFPIAHNEPIGPLSSVAQESDPVRLAMLRAVGIINGVGAFVLHNAAGVTGEVTPTRPANLWEVANIEATMKAVRDVSSFLPVRTGGARHWNNGWAGSPWVADKIWGDGDGATRGVNRNYTVATPTGWVSTVSGVRNSVVFVSTFKSHVDVYDVLLGKVQEADLEAGQAYPLTPLSKDNNGHGAFIVVGTYR